MVGHLSPLNKKLARDLWRIKGQAIAIALVISVGVMLQVMMTGLVASLDETRRAYYERYRLADVFVPVARAPERTAATLREIPGVAAVETRVIGQALLDIDGVELPIRAQAVSLPDFREPRLNAVYLTDGRQFDGNRSQEVVVLKSFAIAHNLSPGDTLKATMNGSRRSFTVVGFAQSPEFLYVMAPGEMVSDDGNFAILWMSRKSLEAAYDMQGAFNEALVSLSRGAEPAAVIAAADAIVDRYGGLGAYGIEDLGSNRFVSEEISGLRASSANVPPVFTAVAAFLLYIVISRMVQAEREEIGLMKAFGYSNIEVGSHYFTMILCIAVGGALLGCLMGIAAGRAMVDIYLVYFKFPFLLFRLDPASFVSGVSISILSASAGGLIVLRAIFALTPADAMRPAAPPDYAKSGNVWSGLNPLLDQPSRMVLRRLTRQPVRMLGAVFGIGAGIALSAAMMSILESFDDMMEVSFGLIDRSEISVTFVHPIELRGAFDLRRIEGVVEVEPVRVVPAILRNGLETYRGGVQGLVPNPRLNRAIDSDYRSIQLPEHGIVLSTGLAATLAIEAGQALTLDVREGRRPLVTVPVTGIAETLLGSTAYMDLGALNRVLNEPLRISGAYLRIDDARSSEIYATIKDMPMVAGVSLKLDERKAFQKVMDEGAGAMRYVMALIAAVITFGVIYNAARVAQAERSRDLATLRVLGFTDGEVGFILLGELAVVTLLALPIGALGGYLLAFAISAGFSTDIYQLRAAFSASSFGIATMIVLGSAWVSGWLVRRDINRADIVTALKTRE